MRNYLITFAVLLPIAVQAGIPTQVELACPVGGERFEITETMSCTEYPARTMAYAPTSSCDFVTRLPQCPQNRLPMYKEFSEADIAILHEFMLSETYDSMVDKSRYFMAYIIERQLEGDNPSAPFWLLLQGFWFDPENTFSDEDYIAEFLFEAQGETRRESEVNRPYLQSIAAFVYIKAGNFDEARALIEAASIENNPVLRAYHRAMEACMYDAASQYCDPNTIIPAP